MRRPGWTIAAAVVLATPGLPAFGQRLLTADDATAAERAFDETPAGAKLRCRVEEVEPRLNLAFRFVTGYRAEVPLEQLTEGKRELTAIMRVTPRGGRPVYLANADGGPAAGSRSFVIVTRGSFVVGEGAYRVEVLVQDRSGRECRASWNLETRRTGNERLMWSAVGPGAVEEVIRGNGAIPEAPVDSKMDRLTVMLHASPLAPNLTELQSVDIDRMLNSLYSVVTQLGARRVRLIVFNLDQGNLFLERDGFTTREIGEVRAALEQVQLGKVDYEVLQRPEKPIQLLVRLLGREAGASEAVVVMGAAPRSKGEAAADSLNRFPAGTVPLFYLQYRMVGSIRSATGGGSESGPPLPRGGGVRGRPDAPRIPLAPRALVDGIEELIKRVKGQTMGVRGPHDLADAIVRIEGRIWGAGGERNQRLRPSP